jgi:hypothetical protein
MEGGDFLGTIYWLWRLYLTWGLIVQSVVAFLILSINTMIMGTNKDKTVQAHWGANVAAIVFYCLTIISAGLLWAFPPSAAAKEIVEGVQKAFM